MTKKKEKIESKIENVVQTWTVEGQDVTYDMFRATVGDTSHICKTKIQAERWIREQKKLLKPYRADDLIEAFYKKLKKLDDRHYHESKKDEFSNVLVSLCAFIEKERS